MRDALTKRRLATELSIGMDLGVITGNRRKINDIGLCDRPANCDNFLTCFEFFKIIAPGKWLVLTGS